MPKGKGVLPGTVAKGLRQGVGRAKAQKLASQFGKARAKSPGVMSKEEKAIIKQITKSGGLAAGGSRQGQAALQSRAKNRKTSFGKKKGGKKK